MASRSSKAARSSPHGIISIVPRTTLRSFPHRSVRAAEVVDAASSSTPIPNVTAAKPIVPNPNTSSSHGPNVTNSDCAAPIKPNMPRIASHAPGASRVVGAVTATCCRAGSGPTRMNRIVPAASTPAAPAPYAQRHDVSAVSTPSALTPISKPSAQDVSMTPTTRPRRSYGT